MTGVETRSVSRDSLFLLAGVKVEQKEEQHRVRVRNLSDGGMMGEGNIRVTRGNRVEVTLRNIGTVEGDVAWVQDQRFGIAFDHEVDSQLARQPSESSEGSEKETTFVSSAHRPPPPPKPQTLRKV